MGKPQSHWDWLTIACLWIGALVMAIKSGGVPLILGAPEFFAAPFWGYVPFVLISVSAAIFLYRAIVPQKDVTSHRPNLPVELPATPQAPAQMITVRAPPTHSKPATPVAPPTPQENPALTVAYLNDLIRNTTKVESKKRIDDLGPQRIRIQAQVEDVAQLPNGTMAAHVSGVSEKYTRGGYFDRAPQQFSIDQAAALGVVKPKDWIEFVGAVTADSEWGWVLANCELVKKIDPPAPPKTVRRRKPAS